MGTREATAELVVRSWESPKLATASVRALPVKARCGADGAIGHTENRLIWLYMSWCLQTAVMAMCVR